MDTGSFCIGLGHSNSRYGKLILDWYSSGFGTDNESISYFPRVFKLQVI